MPMAHRVPFFPALEIQGAHALKVEIEDHEYKVTVGNVDITRQIKTIEISMAPGELPAVKLELTPGSVALDLAGVSITAPLNADERRRSVAAVAATGETESLIEIIERLSGERVPADEVAA